MSDELFKRISDELEIRNLLARVHNNVDAMLRGEDVDYIADWTSDSVWESAKYGRYEGHEGHRRRHESAWFNDVPGEEKPAGNKPTSPTFHLTVNTEVQLDGDEATCSSKFMFASDQDSGAEVHLMGRYEDQVVRTDSGWQLRRRVVFP